ncbi:hypothetical protein HYV49_05200 [Candidatus Pacearchaeota archaeon]|nr:hypothetical protein [Candidatus Pacearchaeota archaeon]
MTKIRAKEDEPTTKEQSAHEKWLSYWQMKIPWPASPDSWETWNAAIETVAEYVDSYDDCSPKELSKELLTKFLDEV